MDQSSQKFSPYLIIQKKRDGHGLSAEEIKFFIEGVTSGKIPDYQTASLLMAIYLNGFNKEETANLTDAMLYSGEVLDFKDPTTIDKHSTGGVGDKTSFIIAPMAAACGVKVPMIAGRGLGHTGGTVDKIESIKNFRTELKTEEFKKLLIKNHLVLMGQTGQIAPADKKIYSLRDVTATIESIPLITASIMSKKLAEGTSGIIMDIKVGSGAFMNDIAHAKDLAESISETALRFNKNIMTMITDMNQPLGRAVGNSLEILECVEVLKGQGPDDLTELCLELAGGMIYLAGKSKDHKEGIEKAKEAQENGKALELFELMIKAQGGETKFIENPSALEVAEVKTEVLSPKNGYIKDFNPKSIGLDLISLGGGRKKTDDVLDLSTGFIFHKKYGEPVKKGESLATIYHHHHQQEVANEIAVKWQNKDIIISDRAPEKRPLIYEKNISWSKQHV